jgi:hypothetical protein
VSRIDDVVAPVAGLPRDVLGHAPADGPDQGGLAVVAGELEELGARLAGGVGPRVLVLVGASNEPGIMVDLSTIRRICWGGSWKTGVTSIPAGPYSHGRPPVAGV